MTEMDDFREHLERYRAVTLQSLDLVDDGELAWRPGPGHYTLGQQFLHIAQAEDFQVQWLLRGDRDLERARFPARQPGVAELRERFQAVRERTLAALAELGPGRLDGDLDAGDGQPVQSLRWWLWLLVEHEVHHKAQIAVYLRQMGKTPPFFAQPLEGGARPDVEAREQMGGF